MIMDIIQAIILGFVQGITEWLPISSSGHLAVFEQLFGLKQPVLFDVMLHLATLAVIFVVFWKDIKNLNKRTITYLLIGSIPIAIVGLFFNETIKAVFYSAMAIGLLFVLNGLVLLLVRKGKNRKVTSKRSLVIGISQAFAILPGISRSGMTLAAGLNSGLSKREAIRFSFLLAIPAIIGAFILEVRNIGSIENIGLALFSSLIAFIVGYYSLKWLIRIVERGKLKYFGYYCVGVGIILLLFL